MTFGPDHYVPVLKVKRGEKSALRELSTKSHSQITPLLEIVERTEKAIDAHLNTAFTDLAESVKPLDRCFLDTREVAADGTAAANQVFSRAASEGIAFVPVTGVSRIADVAAAMSHREHGLALRVTREEFEGGGVAARIQQFLDAHHLQPKEIDLILDLGAVDDMVTAGIMALTTAFLRAVPNIVRWQTVIVSGCAFPKSMGGVERHTHSLVERAEWVAWRDGLHNRRANIERLPTFSDCAIQHSEGVEGFNPITMQGSATIRYTLSDDWLLIKGEGTKKTRPSLQFPALATQLVSGGLRAHFAGSTHCRGCSHIEKAANGAPNLGSLEIWRKIGTIHHITTVTEQLALLP